MLAAIPGNVHRIIMDLGDCLYTIPLHLDGCNRFTFSVCACNFEEPTNDIIGKRCLMEWLIALHDVKKCFCFNIRD